MKVAILGCGAWGYALAHVLQDQGIEVHIWARSHVLQQALKEQATHPKFLNIPLEKGMHVFSTIEESIEGCDYIVESTTAKGIREVLPRIKSNKAPLILTSKGIEIESGYLLPEVIHKEAPGRMLVNLTGPSLAEEVLLKNPTSVVAACDQRSIATEVASMFTNSYFRVYVEDDVIGSACGGALKNVIAIACGVCDGLGFGQNPKAALMAKGLDEMKKIAGVKGGKESTLQGLSGLGDLAVTCLSPKSRNYRFGIEVGKGKKVCDSHQSIGMVVEGMYTAEAVYKICQKYQLDTPIMNAVYHMIYHGLPPKEALKAFF